MESLLVLKQEVESLKILECCYVLKSKFYAPQSIWGLLSKGCYP